MLDCLRNLVAISRTCTAPGTTPLYYLDDLTGIYIEAAEAAITPQYRSGIELLNSKIEMAAEYVENDFRNHLPTGIGSKTLLQYGTLGFNLDNLQRQDATDRYVGIHLESEAEHTALKIQSIRLHVDYTGDVELKVFDVLTGREIDSFTVPAEEGVIIEADVDLSYTNFTRRQHLFIGYDATSIPFYKTEVTKGNKGYCTTCPNRKYAKLSQLQYRGGSFSTDSTALKQNIRSEKHTGGLSLTVSLECSAEPFICTMKNRLAWAQRFKAGALMMQEMRASQRLNPIVQLKSQSKEDLQELYEYEYSKAMNDMVTKIQFPDSDCFYCKKRLTIKSIVG